MDGFKEYGHFGPRTFWQQDTSAQNFDAGQFDTCAEVSGAELSYGYFGTGVELSLRPIARPVVS